MQTVPQNSAAKYLNKLTRTKRSKTRDYRFNASKAKVPTVLNTGRMDISICPEEVAKEKLRSCEEFKCPWLLWSIKISYSFKKTQNNQATKQLDCCGVFLLSLICLLSGNKHRNLKCWHSKNSASLVPK